MQNTKYSVSPIISSIGLQVAIHIVSVAMTGQCRECVVGFGFFLPDAGADGFHSLVYFLLPQAGEGLGMRVVGEFIKIRFIARPSP